MSGFPQQSGEFQAGSKPEVNREAKESGKVDSQIGRRFERLFIYSSGPDCGRMETIVRSDLKGSSWPGVIQGQMVAPSSIIYAYSALGVQAVLPIVLGAFASVKTPRSIRKAVKAAYLERVAKIAYGNVNDRIPHPDEIYNALAGEEGPDDDEDEDEDRVGLQDSLWFPLMASCALFGFFILFKFVDPIWINRFISIYFAGASVFAIQMTGTDFLSSLTQRVTGKPAARVHLRIEEGFKELIHVAYTKLDIIMLPFAITLPVLYIYLGKPWYMTNIISFCFAYSAIKAMKLDGFLTGAALLAGLFVYDIFWVFGTPVMENVAKSLDAPIKVLAPRDMSDWSAGFAMLGLGDIVLPGVFISLALRYDYANHVRRQLKADKKSTPTRRDRYAKPYFFAVLVAYVLGLVTTVVVMHKFKAAQPALLYLSPACIGSVALLAWLRTEFSQTTSWKDEDPVEAGKQKQRDSAVDSPSSEDNSNVEQVLTGAFIARAATCAYLYFAQPKLFPTSMTQPFDTSAVILLQNSSVIDVKSPLQYFLRWDALYYVKIAMEGYRYEQELAFLPGWPLCMRTGGEVVRYIRRASSRGAMELDVFDVLVSGIVLANVLSVAAAIAFYKLTSRVTDNKTFALYATYLYILTTSTATASSPYTEPLFAFFTLTGFFFILPSRISKRAGSKLVLTKTLGILLLTAASGTRSLGILNSAVVLTQGFIEPMLKGDRRFLVNVKRGVLSALACLFITLPFIAFQYLAYRSFCLDENTRRPWCDVSIPSVYSFVQEHYWNVGFLRYWTVSQIPNFLLAAPVLLSSLYSIYDYACQGPQLISVRSNILGYLGLHIALTYILITSSHTQIALRTMGSNPLFWWGLAQQVWQFRVGPEKVDVKLGRAGKPWLIWAIVWTAASLILWAGFYPPA